MITFKNITNKKKLNLKINHRNWQEALALAFAFLVSVEPGEVVCIIGPPRAGKTRLILELCQLLFGAEYARSGKFMPAVIVEVVNSAQHGTFSTKDFVLRMLAAINHPLVWREGEIFDIEIARQKFERISEPSLRIALEAGLIARRTQFLFIDEAQHAKYVSKSAMGAHAVLDSWKCLAKSAAVVLVLVGAYPLLEIVQGSAHLVGRKNEVNLPRYSSSQDDLLEFAAIIESYEPLLTVCPTLGHLNECIDILYTYSLGCIGLLRSWLTRAEGMASIKGSGITKDILLKVRLSDSDLEVIEKEILAGEQILFKQNKFTSNKSVQQNASTSRKTNQKPFQRKPTRMKAGNRLEGEK